MLNNGVHIPKLGLGVWQVEEGKEVIQSVRHALEAGYRSIDTEAGYQNERGIGIASKQCGIQRDSSRIS